MKITYRKIFGAVAMLLLPAVLGSCRDDLILEDGGSASWSDDGKGGFVFAIGATQGGFDDDHTSMISTDPEETVINENNFHVVLFDAKGAVVEDWENQEISKIKEPSAEFGGIERTKYFVRIPRKKIQDSTLDLIRTQPFKIAVFANWADYPKFTRDKNETIDENGINRNNLFFISHSHADDSYGNNEGVDGEMQDSEVFGFITGAGSKMGVAQEWVADRFKDDAEADDAIRRKYQINEDGTGKFVSDESVTLTNTSGMTTRFDMDTYTYNDVWQIWNFGGEKNYDPEDNETFYKSTEPNNRIKWAQINNDWYEKCFNSSSDANQKVDNETSIRGLTVYHPDNSSVQGRRQTINGSTYYPIELKHYNRATGVTKIEIANGSYLHYKLPADGYMYIKCQAETSGAKLVARRGGLNTTSSIKQVELSPATGKIDVLELDYTNDGNQMIRVTGEPQDFVLYALGGTVWIYEIDYIKSRMIQSVDRQMINPTATPEGGISMYGIQDFEPAGLNVWPEGTTFNLSRYETTHTGKDAPSYKYRSVSLLRSVSKVEVYVPKSIFPKPSHMYLRTINRFSRSAPIDIFTPTNIIWDGWQEGNGYENGIVEGWNMGMNATIDHYYQLAPGIDVEAENIRKYGFTYKTYDNTVSDEEKKSDYRNAVSWLFGLWDKEFGWDWGGDPTVRIDPNKPRPYPRVFNTRIARTDYAHMLYGGEKDGCYYYYAYLPEKNLTDPNNKGTLDDSPKVMRVEMRFGDRNSDVNLDDNASYRIYFMPGGKGEGVTDRDSYDGVLETGSADEESVQMQNLHKMYPIMRNHLYRFKITGIDMNGLNVNFQVKGADTRDINYTFD